MPIYNTSILDNLEMMKSFVDEGGKEDLLMGGHAVVHAAANGLLEILKYLVSIGADISLNENNAVHLAARHGNLEILKFLASCGADVTGWYTLRGAACGGQGQRRPPFCGPPPPQPAGRQLEVIKYLISMGSDCKDKYCIIGAAEKGHLDIVEYLVSLEFPINCRPKYAIEEAAKHGHLDVVKYLVSIGEDATMNCNRPARCAAQNGFIEVVKYLISVGAGIKSMDMETVKFLISFHDMGIIRSLILLGMKYENCGLEKILGCEILPSSMEELMTVIDMCLVNKE